MYGLAHSQEERHQQNLKVLKEALELAQLPVPQEFVARPKSLRLHKDADFIFDVPNTMKPFEHSKWSDQRRQDALLVYELSAIFHHYHNKLTLKDAIKAATAYINKHRPHANPCWGKVAGTCPKGFPPELCPCDKKNADLTKAFNIPWDDNMRSNAIRQVYEEKKQLGAVLAGLNPVAGNVIQANVAQVQQQGAPPPVAAPPVAAPRKIFRPIPHIPPLRTIHLPPM